MNKILLTGLLLALGGCAATPPCTHDWNSDACRIERLLQQNDLMQARYLVAARDPDGYPLAEALLLRAAPLDRRGETAFYRAVLAIRRGQPASEVLPLLEEAAAADHPHAIALLYKLYREPLLLARPDSVQAQRYREAYDRLDVARSGYPPFEKALQVVTQLIGEPPPPAQRPGD